MKRSPDERRRRIEQALGRGQVSVRALARELRVSEVTIRRDLKRLNTQGKLLRVYGGAVADDRMAYEFSFREKEGRRREEKAAIGRAAARLVEPGEAVFLDTGTTTLAVARSLRLARVGLIVTINLCVASEYVGQRDTRVLVPGGEVSHLSPDLFGEWTLERLADMNVDVAFLGCDGVDAANGFYAADPKSAAVARLMLRQSRRAFLVADSAKFGRRAMVRIASVAGLTGVVTDSRVPRAQRRRLNSAGLKVIVAAPSG